ncbi:MAG: hypothetical protein NWF04_01975, partial [Candidatus Bathyarchaeota archaeon]|nr:hypothetical protein [Candidatus Bathyarchaeota archaeon]
KTTVEIWEAIINKLKQPELKEQAGPEFVMHLVYDPQTFLEEHFSTVWIDQNSGIKGLYGLLREKPDNPQPVALLFSKEKGWDLQKMKEWLEDHPQYARNHSETLPEPPEPLGEAIIASTEPLGSDLIHKTEILKLLPEDWIVRAWSLGPQLLVRQLRHRLNSQSTQLTGSKQG